MNGWKGTMHCQYEILTTSFAHAFSSQTDSFPSSN